MPQQAAKRDACLPWQQPLLHHYLLCYYTRRAYDRINLLVIDLMPRVYVYIVRHGETLENVAGIIQGQKDTILNVTGRAQSELAAEALRNVPFEISLTSDLKRARDVRDLSGYLTVGNN